LRQYILEDQAQFGNLTKGYHLLI